MSSTGAARAPTPASGGVLGSDRGVRARLALWFALTIGSLGALHPFLAMTLSAYGLSSVATAATLALFPAGLLTAGLLWGWLADASGQPVRWLRLSALSAALAAVVVALAPTCWPAIQSGLQTGAGARSVGLVVLIAGLGGLAIARAPLVPLVDALTVSSLHDDSAAYGRVRLWGSVAFAAAVFGVGALMDDWPAAPLVISAVLLCGGSLVTWYLPRARFEAPRASWADFTALQRDPSLRRLLWIATLHGLAHASYDFLFSLHMEQLGAPTSHITAAFLAGLSVEIGLMAMAPWLLRRLGGVGLIRLAVATSVPRFLLTGLALPTALIAATQVLHGVSFGAFWLGAVAVIAGRAHSGLHNSAQAMLMAASAGVGPLLLLIGASALLQVVPLAQLFWLASALSAVAYGLARGLGGAAVD